jgi:hypothetical protein
MAYDDTNFRRNALLRRVANVINRSFFMNEKYFKTIGPKESPGGDRITFAYNYSTTSNGGFMSAITDPFPDSDDMDSVNAYFTKDYIQATSKTFDILANQVEVNRDGRTTEGFTTYENESIDNAAKNLESTLRARFVTDLIAQIDDAGTYSDAALTRSTYRAASYEDDTGGALTLAMLEDAIEALGTDTYGSATPEMLLFLMSPNQWTNLSRLVTGTTSRIFGASADGTSDIDGGIRNRVKFFDSIPVMVDNAM